MINKGVSGDIPLEEFKNLLDILDTKNKILFRECRFDQKKARHIRSMGAILAAMTVMVDRRHQDSGTACVADIFTDAQGFTYQTVRSCDLDRLCDK
jgi:hypothetical protein